MPGLKLIHVSKIGGRYDRDKHWEWGIVMCLHHKMVAYQYSPMAKQRWRNENAR